MEKLLNKEQDRFAQVTENLKIIRERVAQAAQRSKRQVEEITLLAATKTVPVEVINHVIAMGVDHIGENRVQEWMQKQDALALTHCKCHFIGHLQTNKVKYLVGRVDMIQSVDSVRLAREIARLSVARGVVTDILLEINIGREENKSGVFPEQIEEMVESFLEIDGIRLRGFMTIPPICAEIARTKDYFLQMHHYYVDIKAKKLDNKIDHINILSMGMSSDYEEAIACGATLVRVGTSLFGNRVYR